MVSLILCVPSTDSTTGDQRATIKKQKRAINNAISSGNVTKINKMFNELAPVVPLISDIFIPLHKWRLNLNNNTHTF